MGLTSRAKMAQVGVDEVIWGRLTDAMRLEEGASLSRAKYVHPRIEPELAFLLKRPNRGRADARGGAGLGGSVAPAMEIIDSRYRNFKFALPDVIADNSSSSGFVVGPWASPTRTSPISASTMEVNGRPVEIGSTAAILGDPIRSLVAAARLAAPALGGLKAGWIVLAGGATAAHSLKVGESVRRDAGARSGRHTCGELTMPIVEITMIEGRTPEAKRRLIAKVTDAIVEAVDAPRASIRIILREVPPMHFGVAGKTKEPGSDAEA